MTDQAEVSAEERIGYLIGYWALGRDPEPTDEMFLHELAEALGESSVPAAVEMIADSLREGTDR